MTVYYNEFDPFAAQWLRKLIDAGLIAPGVVDDRSITDVTPSDLKGFTQCHFFAGVGGWSYALRLASVPDFFPCWTGSPPCQPFSTAGKQLGQLDERHLAPTFMHLVAQCRPAVLFGEQVAAAISKHWLDDLFLELENENYTCGAAVLPACGVGAPHNRDRLFFGAAMDYANDAGAQGYGRFEPVIFPQGRENEKRHALSSDVAARLWSGWKADTGADGTTRSLPAGFGTPAYGLSTRVGRLRGYGNAIAPHVAAEFITAFMAASTEAAA
ncbi:DNA cytosine methyltransferase [Pantoea ananatis]|uniref:DNA cytosine methyltransferase n=1 Tax=Pantoea ananas TaxID=553 RepID=UPI000CF537D3|nr:DNA cytosine methyltransferase [Pantoea ananatis]PQK77807.1 hypothetical protein CG430_12645 [Pantoea ananatis]